MRTYRIILAVMVLSSLIVLESTTGLLAQWRACSCLYLPLLQHNSLDTNSINAAETPATLAASSGAFVEQSGQVVIEVEHFDTAVSRSSQSWVAHTDRSGYTGDGAMMAEPNQGTLIDSGYATTSPEMRYQVQFATSGTYFVWLRGTAASGNDDSAHVGLNGQAVASATALVLPTSTAGQWGWSNRLTNNTKASLNIPSAGTYTINIWMREDGVLLDRLLLTKSTATPSGAGPAESARVAAPTNTATATRTNTPTATRSATSVPTNTPTVTRVATPTRTNTPTATRSATSVPTNTATPATGGSGGQLGTTVIQSQQDSNSPGQAEAFVTTASATGSVDTLTLYVDSASTATSAIVGLYANSASNHPGALLVQTTITSLRKGAWNSGTFAPISVTAGTSYWIAVLGPTGGGTLFFRDGGSGGQAETSAATTLASLPSSWTTGQMYNSGPLAAYASFSGGGSAPTSAPMAAPTSAPTSAPTASPTSAPTATPVVIAASATATPCCAATNTPVSVLTSTASVPTSTASVPTSTASVPTSTPTGSDPGVKEAFENTETAWQVAREVSGGGSVSRSSAQAAAGSFAARAATSSASGQARLSTTFSDAASSHQWEERPGTFFWQRASIYLPSSTVAQLGANQYLTLGSLYPSSGGSFGWSLRVKANGELYVYGYPDNNGGVEFRAYGVFPQNRWVDVELGLHTQAGPGVKRSFAFLVDGTEYGWFRQGNMGSETYDRAAFGILSTNASGALEVYVDQWRNATSALLPTGPDSRSTANLQEQLYTSQNGAQVQYDWSTWKNSPTLNTQSGLYTPSDRLQAGRNLDRMPDVSNGWAEIEVGWPSGTPPTPGGKYFGPMVGFRKEVNREENLEVIPVKRTNGSIELVLEAWVGSEVELAAWPMPVNPATGSRLPEPGDIMRARWEQVSSTQLAVRVSYYDASAGVWYKNIIDGTYKLDAVSDGTNSTVNYFDGYHTASSITIDTTAYGIRRFKLGTLPTYVEPQ